MSVTSGNDLETEHRNLLFGIRRSVRYHSRRRQFYEAWNTLTSAVSVLFGSTAIAATFGMVSEEHRILVTAVAAALVTLVSTLDLVVGTVRKAQLHADLGRRFSELECVAAEDSTYERLSECRKGRVMIEADEPPQLRVVSVLTHNELCRAIGRHDHVYDMPFWRRLVGQLINIDPAQTLRKPSEAEAV